MESRFVGQQSVGLKKCVIASSISFSYRLKILKIGIGADSDYLPFFFFF